MKQPTGAAIVVVTLGALTAACGKAETVASQSSSGVLPVAAQPSSGACAGANGAAKREVNVGKIKGNSPASSSDLDSTSAKQVAMPSGDDAKSFTVHAKKADLNNSGIDTSSGWSDDLVVIVKHGSFMRNQMPGYIEAPLNVPSGAPAPPDLGKMPINYVVTVYDKATHTVVDRLDSAENACFHE